MNPAALRRRQRVVGLVVLAAAAGVVALALRPPAPLAAGGGGAAGPEVALWSARRLPEGIAEIVAARRVPGEVSDALGSTDSCFILDVGGRRLVADDVGTGLVPASTQKLLTGAAALAVLGPDHRFATRAMGAGERLFLEGGGDPGLATVAYAGFLKKDGLTKGQPTTSIEKLADEVATSGVKHIAQVVGDASRHEGRPTVPTWKPEYTTQGHVSRLSALTVNGGWTAWDPQKVAAGNPALEAARVFTELLRDRGVKVSGPPGLGRVPEGAQEVGAVESVPVAEIVEAMVRGSDNTTSELLAREVGLATGGHSTTPAGAAAVVEALAGLDVPTRGVRLVDGSGLDRGNRVTCEALFATLELAREQPRIAALEHGLAVAGKRGTLHDRMEKTPYVGKLRAKTGGLLGVTGLVGVYEGERPLWFAMVANGSFDTLSGFALQERVAGVLHRYPFVFADPDVLAPSR